MVTPMRPLAAIEKALARLRPQWFEEARSKILDDVFSAASRSLGKASFTLEEDEAQVLALTGIRALETWGLDELGRVALLLGPNVSPETIERCYFRGDNRERQAVLKALPLHDEPTRFIPLAVEACRSNVEDVFRAIACGNPFPARHFPPDNVHQMVMKAIFNGIPLSGIVGLAERVTPELIRMANDYEAERRAAGRSVPEDLAVLRAMAERGTP